MKKIEVVAAIITHEDKIFATQRGYGEYKGGWEFPGGKIEKGENDEEALKREIMEELGTEISVEDFLMTVEHDYTDFHLTMHCYWCQVEKGNLELKEHLDSRWLNIFEIDSVNWLPADIEVVRKIKTTGVYHSKKNRINQNNENDFSHAKGGELKFKSEIKTEIIGDIKKNNSEIVETGNSDIRPSFGEMSDFIKGQDEIKELLDSMIKKEKLNLFSFFLIKKYIFSGYTGCGRTSLAKAFIKCATGREPHIVNALEFKNSDEFRKYMKNFKDESFIFEEFEKADKSVQRAAANFSESGKNIKYLIFEVNLHSDDESKADTGTIKKYLENEVLAKIRKIIIFNKITEDIYTDIIKSRYSQIVSELCRNKGISGIENELKGAEIRKIVINNYDRDFGAENAEYAVRDAIETSMILNNK